MHTGGLILNSCGVVTQGLTENLFALGDYSGENGRYGCWAHGDTSALISEEKHPEIVKRIDAAVRGVLEEPGIAALLWKSNTLHLAPAKGKPEDAFRSRHPIRVSTVGHTPITTVQAAAVPNTGVSGGKLSVAPSASLPKGAGKDGVTTKQSAAESCADEAAKPAAPEKQRPANHIVTPAQVAPEKRPTKAEKVGCSLEETIALVERVHSEGKDGLKVLSRGHLLHIARVLRASPPKGQDCPTKTAITAGILAAVESCSGGRRAAPGA